MRRKIRDVVDVVAFLYVFVVVFVAVVLETVVCAQTPEESARQMTADLSQSMIRIADDIDANKLSADQIGGVLNDAVTQAFADFDARDDAFIRDMTLQQRANLFREYARGWAGIKVAAQEPMISGGEAERSAVRIINGNACGSGAVVGWWEGGSLILTNAHVAGTQVGRAMTVRAVVGGQTIEKTGRVIVAAYSDRTLSDWAILSVPNWQQIQPVKLTKEKPRVNDKLYTRGSPRCVWPQETVGIQVAEVRNDGLVRWRPQTIGGQSGSSVWNTDHHGQILLTWLWGGLGAGQGTFAIYEQAQNQNVSTVLRPEGLVEPPWPPAAAEANRGRPRTDNGYFVAPIASGVGEMLSIVDLPIWVGDDEEPEPDPDPDPQPITEMERQALDAIKLRAEGSGLSYEDALKYEAYQLVDQEKLERLKKALEVLAGLIGQ